MTEYALIPKIVPGLRRLRQHYEIKGEQALIKLIDSARIYIVPCTEHDNWNGGQYGHDVYMFVPEEAMRLVDLDTQDQIFQRLTQDLNKATSVIENEYVRAVFIQPANEADPHYQASVPFTSESRTTPEATGLWRGNHLRVFLSHRDIHKAAAHSLAHALEPFGISTFVAHDAIKPTKEWEREILNGLMTMEVMLILLTDDFHDSNWTNQEVGFALAKGIPTICIKVGNTDPQGFIASKQALRASYDDIALAASQVQRTLIEEIGQEGRLKEVLIESFLSSTSYVETMERLQRLTETAHKLTDKEFNCIVEGYAKNDQLYTCGGIHYRGNWFKRYLESATGKQIAINDRQITELKVSAFDDAPF